MPDILTDGHDREDDDTTREMVEDLPPVEVGYEAPTVEEETDQRKVEDDAA